MLTISVIDFPVKPFHSPEIIFSEKSSTSFKTRLISGFTSVLLITILFDEESLRAVCKTALFSVVFIISPEKYFWIASFKSTSFTSSINRSNVSFVILFLE